jgi:phosphatidylglycerol lysyltransferase
VCVLALAIRELSGVDWSAAVGALRSAHSGPILWGALATLVCVSEMGLYDVLSMRAGSSFSGFERWRLGTAICSWTNFLAVGPLAGPALRTYFYRRAGMDVPGIVRGLAGIYAGMFAGIAGWIGALFVPLPAGSAEPIVRVAIAAILCPLVCIGVGSLLRRVRRGWALEGSAPYTALGLVGFVEWSLVILVFGCVARATDVDTEFVPLARAFFVGHVAGSASLVPGGLGSADAVWLKMTSARGAPAANSAARVLLFRCVYFLWPWALSIVGLVVFFVRRSARRVQAAVGSGPGSSGSHDDAR